MGITMSCMDPRATWHGSLVRPSLPFPLDADLAIGFEERDCNQIGNWRRDKNGQPLSEAPPRRGQEAEKRAQLRVCTRLVRIVAAAIRHYGDWKKLPSTGSESWYALFPEGDIQRVEAGINAELDASPVDTTDTHVAP